MNYLNIYYLLLNICAYLTIIASQSPCPNIFMYQYDNNNKLYGSIQLSNPVAQNNIILLDVQLSIGNTVQGYNGNIALVTPRSNVIDNIFENRPIDYRVEFPYWDKIPPKITQIRVNGNQICSGYPIDRNMVPVVTTVNLQHTLTISVPLSTGSNINNMAPVVPEPPVNTGMNERQTNSPVSGFQPVNQIMNFNPQQPNDPSKIYGSNPFSNTNTFFPGTNMFFQSPTNQAGNGWQNSFNGGFNPMFQNIPNMNNFQTYSNPNQNTPWMTPTNADPRNPTVLNQQDVTPSPKNPVAPVKPTPFAPQLPKRSEVDDLPTVESNLVRKPFSGVCGISVNGNALLINGNNVTRGSHPWLGALFIQKGANLEFICGSTLISQKHVVTAAHCVRAKPRNPKPEDLWIVLGRENIQRWSNDGAQILQAQSTHSYPGYDFTSADADIAVIVLSDDVVFSNLVRPICLWTGNTNQKLIVEKKGTVLGWGKDENGRVSTPEPKQLTFPVVSEEDCLWSNPGFREITSNRTFCAGYRNNSGPCNGDSGSGFLMLKNGRWTLRGVVSMSLLGPEKSCDLSNYIVFADAALFMDWLLAFIN